MLEFLSLVFYSHALPENLPEVLQKGSKFVGFWAEIHKLHVLLSVSGPLVMKKFSGVEIHGFCLQKDLIKAINFRLSLLKELVSKQHNDDYLTCT